MEQFAIKEHYNMEDYRALMHFLRGPQGCPWDRVQTHESIRRNVLEEAYETAHAIDSGDTDNLREELGDLLMQVLFHAEMEEEKGTFDLDGIADTACKKLVFRHPHVFGTQSAEDPEAVLATWDEQKRAEKGQKTVSDTLAAVAETLPALWRAEKILKKAEKADASPVTEEERFAAIRTETENLISSDGEEADRALGDLLLAAAGIARSRGIDPEMSLHRACERYIARFTEMEQPDGKE